MSMRSKDLEKNDFKEKLVQAFNSTDPDSIVNAFTDFAESVQQNVLNEFYKNEADMPSTSKSTRQLTPKEKNFYQKLINGMKSNNPTQAFTGLDTAFPQTIIDNVIEDIKAEHPLLDNINFVNTTILTKILVNKQGTQLATWGPINSQITTELSGAIGKIDLTICKLTAFMPISKDMLDAGPEWIDAYVRSTLSEAIALALETAIITGTGKDMPIGMDRDISDNVSVTDGVYPKKTAITITDLSPLTYGSILSKLAQAPNNKTRTIKNLLFIVNPVDYFSKVMPGTTVLTANGTYANNLFPYPTTVIQSVAVDQGKVIFGIGDKYFMGIGPGAKGGNIEYSDQVHFLEDERVYLTKMFGNGRALDNNAFILADISGLTPAAIQVTVINKTQS